MYQERYQMHTKKVPLLIYIKLPIKERFKKVPFNISLPNSIDENK